MRPDTVSVSTAALANWISTYVSSPGKRTSIVLQIMVFSSERSCEVQKIATFDQWS